MFVGRIPDGCVLNLDHRARDERALTFRHISTYDLGRYPSSLSQSDTSLSNNDETERESALAAFSRACLVSSSSRNDIGTLLLLIVVICS